MSIYLYRPRGEVHPIGTSADSEKEARKFFRDWSGVKRLEGEVWKQ